MRGFARWLLAAVSWSLLTSMAAPAIQPDLSAIQEPAPSQPAAAAPLPPPPPLPLTVSDTLADGVTIVISKPSQMMFVFRDGELWRSSPVSTGKRGHTTPSGVFAILQKRVKHRSNLYSNAPMPYMQRLTWSGIALHAGHLPGYPASHGCIRMPHEFARALYDLTRFDSTAVIVTDEPLAAHPAAAALAGASEAVVPVAEEFLLSRQTRLAGARRTIPARAPLTGSETPSPAAMAGGRSAQTIQLAAALSPREAHAHWSGLVSRRPDLERLQPAIVPAVVNARQYYRLRVTAPGAHALCGNLKRSGIDCFAVT